VSALVELAAAAVTGLVLGFALTASWAVAAISRSQERMERKVRYWQAETARLRAADKAWAEPPSR
jgi:hypothetical protein